VFGVCRLKKPNSFILTTIPGFPMSYLKVFSPITIFAAGIVFSSAALSTSAPTIGGMAKINVTLGDGGIVNAAGSAGASSGTAKQAVGSVLAGNISGAVDITVDVTKGAILNVGGSGGVASATACQSVGTIGSDCD
jgi:hypothetical protein